MADDDGKIKTKPAPKNDALPKDKNTPDAAPSKAEGGAKDVDLSSGYSRGERQKPVSKAYKENWNLIFAKKKAITPIERASLWKTAEVAHRAGKGALRDTRISTWQEVCYLKALEQCVH